MQYISYWHLKHKSFSAKTLCFAHQTLSFCNFIPLFSALNTSFLCFYSVIPSLFIVSKVWRKKCLKIRRNPLAFITKINLLRYKHLYIIPYKKAFKRIKNNLRVAKPNNCCYLCLNTINLKTA